jgi:protein-L-isoaspartate O-methyltransferase
MPDAFFLGEYRRKAALMDPLEQAGRGKEFQGAGFEQVVKETLALLAPDADHDVLDVGCANGLLDRVLSRHCRRLFAIDPVEELVALARKNLAPYANVRVDVGHGAAVASEDDHFDRVLMLEVLQLVVAAEARAIFAELRRVTRPGGRILIGAVPDARRREEILGPYLEGVRDAAHLSTGQKADILARNERASWFDPTELVTWWDDLGCEAVPHAPSPSYPNADHRFHLIVSVTK